MGLMSLVSRSSLRCGYEYYKEERVHSKKINSATEFEAKVDGNGKAYNVIIDVEHPRKSKCNCPHANGKRVICKHMIALYFSAFPKEAQKYYNDVVSYEEEQEKLRDMMDEKVEDYIKSLSKEELQTELYALLYDSPEWVFERFYREKVDSNFDFYI